MSKLTKRERAIWRAALTLANNECVRISDWHNGEDEIDDANVAAQCAENIRKYLDEDDATLIELFKEAGVPVERDWLGEALNSGNGVYRP